MLKSSFKINSKTNLKINNKAKFILAVALISILVMLIAVTFIHKEKNYDDAISQSMKLYMLSYKIANSADEVELEQLQAQLTIAKEITTKLMHQNTKLKQPFDSLFSSIEGIYSQKQLALTKQIEFTVGEPSDWLVKVQEAHLQIGKLVGDQDIEHLIPALFGENVKLDDFELEASFNVAAKEKLSTVSDTFTADTTGGPKTIELKLTPYEKATLLAYFTANDLANFELPSTKLVIDIPNLGIYNFKFKLGDQTKFIRWKSSDSIGLVTFGENGVIIKPGMESAYYETLKLGRMMGLVEAIIWGHEETKALPNRKMYL
jgi:hypothetical protein